MGGPSAPARTALATCAALAVAALAAVVVSRWAVRTGSLIDTGVFRSVAHAVLQGRSPYGLPTQVPFVYPPAGALLALLASAGSSITFAAGTWCAVSLAALGRTAWLLGRLAWPTLPRVALVQRCCWLFAVACLLEPTRALLSLGQVGLLLLWLTVEGLARQPDAVRRTWLVGAAAAMKLTPAVVLPGLAAAGRWRSLAWAVVGLVATCAVAAAVAPAAVRDYLAGAWRLARDVNSEPNALNHSVPGLAAALGAPDVVSLLLGVLVLAAGTVVCALLWRRGDELAGIATILVTGLLASPVSWVHHWVAAYPALLLLVRELPTRRVGAVLLLGGAVAGMLLGTDARAWGDAVGVLHVLPHAGYVVWGAALLGWVAAPLLRTAGR